MKKFVQKFLAAILAIALVVTGLYPTQYVHAATTTSTGDGLAFNSEDYGYYVADEVLDAMPQKFEATVRLDNTTVLNAEGNSEYKYWRTGIIFSNTDLETPGTFEFGFHTGNRPYVAFINDAGTRVEKIFATKSSENHNSVFMTGDFLEIAIVNDKAKDQMICYLNGSEWATVDGAYTDTLTPSLPACIGGDYREANTQFFKGSIKDVAIYDGESNLISEYELGLTSDNAEYPEILEDLAGSYDMKRTKYHFMTEAEKEEVSPRPDYDFSMAVIGDLQVVTGHSIPEEQPGEVDKIFQWVADNAAEDKKNIKFAFNMGDTTDSYRGSKTDEEYEALMNKEWAAGASAIKILDNKVPYSIVRGNHDATDKYLENFSWADYSSKVSGSYADNMLNTYQKFEVEGIKYMVVNLDFGISSDAAEAESILEWANDVVAQNPEYKVIVTTHAYMANDGSLMSDGENGDPTTYGMAKSGQDIWDEFVSQHENIVLALCGHMGTGEVMQNEMVGVHGNKVMQLLVNPQEIDARFYDSGYGTMCGMVTMLYFSGGGKTVHAEYYSVLRDKYYSPTSQFSFNIDSGSGLDFWTPEYDYYEGKETFTETPKTFEATVKVTSEDVWIPAYIMGNTDTSSGTALGEGFALGFGKGHVPQLVIVDEGKVLTYNFLKESTHIYGDATYYHIFRGKRVHLAVVNDTTADKMYCYVNGELFATVDGAFTGTLDNAAPLVIGGDIRTQKSRSFKGSIKDIAIFSTARTAAEVQNDYANGIAGTENGIMAAYKIDLGTDGTWAKTLTDLSGNDVMTRNKRLLSEAEKEAMSPRGEFDYSMVVVGDPQVLVAHDREGDSYAEGGNPYVDGQAARMFDWIIQNKDDLKIKFAFNLGDTTDSYQGSKTDEEYAIQVDEEWDIGSAAVKKLDGKIPYSIVRGNHDATDKYTEHFAWVDYSSKVSGSYEENMLNTYQKFEVNGIKYMVVNLDLGVSDNAGKANGILAWANDIVAANPDHNVIVTTHAYLDPDGTRIEDDEPQSLKARYGMQKNGSDMWDEFISLHKNIFMVLSGHRESTPIAKNESYGVHGNKIVEFMINAQGEDVMFNSNLFKKNDSDTFNTMTGNVAMLYFSNGGKTVKLEYYSTLWGKCYTEESQISFDVNCIAEEQIFNLKDGAVAIPYSMVDMTGDVPVPVSSEYQHYLFAGWYTGAGCTIDTAVKNKEDIKAGVYAKFIPREILTVKAQVSTSTMPEGTEQAGKWAFRFVSTIDNLDYNRVGFKVTWIDENGQVQTKTSITRTVYDKIASTDSQVNCNFSPDVFSKNSNYFITAKLAIDNTDIAKATDYTVQAYIRTIDGTIVYGPERVVSLNDGLTNNSINMVINQTLVDDASYTATYMTGNYVNVEAEAGEVDILSTGDGYTNVRIPRTSLVTGTDTEMRSATKVIIKDSNGNEVANEIYRNYYTTHDRGWETPNADYSWYYVDENADEFILGSSADLYGFNTIIGWGDHFTDKTVRLVVDIVMNKGTAVRGSGSIAPSWQQAEGANLYKWQPQRDVYADGGKWFNGTFDGCGNTISGLYMDESGSSVGLFGSVGPKAVIRNCAIANSYIHASGDFVGSFVGFSYAAKLENLYSDAVIHSTYSTGTWSGQSLGGIVGHMDTPTAGNTHVLSGAWFDGQLYYSGANQQIGGIAGKIYDSVGSTFKLYDCLFSGDIYMTSTSGYRDGAGIVSGVAGTAGMAEIYMANCLNTGTIKGAGCYGIGAALQTAKGGSISNCYAVESTVYSNAFYNTGTGITLVNLVNKGIVTEDSIKFTTEADLLEKFPLLSGQSESAWMCKTSESGTGTPILKAFAEHWSFAKENGYDISWFDENATEYTLDSKQDLKGFALMATNTNFEGKTIKLAKDIVLNEGKATNWKTTAPEYAWNPISEFAGTFDGQGHTISGVYIEGNSDKTGFFKTLTATADVCNVGIVNSYIKTNYDYTGAIAGLSYAKRIENVYSDAIINSSYSTGTWNGQNLGGIVGQMNTPSAENTHTISGVWFDGQVNYTGANQQIGGIAGIIYDSYGSKFELYDCLFSGDILMTSTSGYRDGAGILSGVSSGAAGNAELYMANCLNTGTITGAGSYGIGSALQHAKGGTITNCYAVESTVYTSAFYNTGTGIALSNQGVVTKDSLLYTTQSDLETLLPLHSEQTESPWMCNTDGYVTETPILKDFADYWDSKQVRSYDISWYDENATKYILDSKEDLKGFALVATKTDFAGKTIKLAKDIVLNEGTASDWETTVPEYAWNPIPEFAGTFNGQGHTISGVYIEGSSEKTGFFKTLTATADVCNVGIVNSYIKTAYDYTGAIAGLSHAKRIENVYTDATVHSTYSTGTWNGQNLGGLVGQMDTPSAGNTHVISNAWFDGRIYYEGANQQIGGIVGKINDNYGSIFKLYDCLFSGELHMTSTSGYRDGAGIISGIAGTSGVAELYMANCLNTGTVTGAGSYGIGAALQSAKGGSIANCYAVESTVYTSAFYDTGTGITLSNQGVVTEDSLKFTTEADLIVTLPVLSEQSESAWMCNTDGYVTGTPILKGFAEYWDSKQVRPYDVSWYDENATKYTLDSKEDLKGFALVATKTDFAGKTIKLAKDIVLNEGTASDWETTAPEYAWNPIPEFAGTFDGQGHTISGVYIEGSSEKTGFFKALTATAEVCNVGIVNSYIKTNYDYAGAVAGYSYAERIENVYSDAIINSTYSASGNWSTQSLGGIVGQMDTPSAGNTHVLSGAWFDGQINYAGNRQRIGGVVGQINDSYGSTFKLDDCLFSGEISYEQALSSRDMAGIVPYLSGDGDGVPSEVYINNCLNTGTFTGSGTGAMGIVFDFRRVVTGTITNCYAVKSSSYTEAGKIFAGDWFEYMEDSQTPTFVLLEKESLQFVTKDELLAKLPLHGEQTESAWACNTCGSETGTPILKTFACYYWSSAQVDTYDVSWYDKNATEYTIDSKEELYGLALLSNVTNFAGKTIKLGADIVLNEGEATDWEAAAPANVWNPIPEFAGTFDGQGHTISGVYIEGSSEKTGFFKALTATAEVCNVGIVNSYIKTNYDYTGAIAGLSHAKRIENVYSDATVHSTYSTGTWNGQNLGGLIGQMETPSAGNTHVLSGAWFDGRIYYEGANQQIGGLVGKINDNYGSIFKLYDCLFSGDLHMTSTSGYRDGAGIISGIAGTSGVAEIYMANCLNTGTITGTGSYGIGAALQSAKGGSISNCYAVESTVYSSAFYDTGAGITLVSQGVVTEDSLKFTTEADLIATLPVLSEQSESAWMCNTSDSGTGTPILKAFAQYWQSKQSTSN